MRVVLTLGPAAGEVERPGAFRWTGVPGARSTRAVPNPAPRPPPRRGRAADDEGARRAGGPLLAALLCAACGASPGAPAAAPDPERATAPTPGASARPPAASRGGTEPVVTAAPSTPPPDERDEGADDAMMDALLERAEEQLDGEAGSVFRVGASLYVCPADRCAGPIELTPPAEGLSITTLFVDGLPADVWGVVVEWERQLGDVATTGSGLLLLDVAAPAQVGFLTLAERRVALGPREGLREDLDHPDVERAGGCVRIGAPEASTRTLHRSGAAGRPRALRLEEAPALLPAEGVDPFRVSLEGTWALTRQGFVRVERCPASRAPAAGTAR